MHWHCWWEYPINDLNLQLERVIVVPTMTWNMCNFVISWYCHIVVDTTVMICIFAILRFCDTQLWNWNICMFGELWFWTGIGFYNHDFRAISILRIWCCSWGTTTWNPGFTLFWWNQNSLNSSVNWVVAVWKCQRCFHLTVARCRLPRPVGCDLSPMTHVNQLSSFELRLTHTWWEVGVWRGQTHPMDVCCLTLVCGRRNRKRMETVLELTQPIERVAQGETCEPVKSQYMTPSTFGLCLVLVCVAVCNC